MKLKTKRSEVTWLPRLLSLTILIATGVAQGQVATRPDLSALPFVEASLDVTVSIDNNSMPSSVGGRIRYTFPHAPGERICFYLAYNDPAFEPRLDFAKRYDLVPQKFSSVGRTRGITSVEGAIPLQNPEPWLIEITVPSETRVIDFDFTSTVPRLPNAEAIDWYYEGFYPSLLARCPTKGISSAYYEREAYQRFLSRIQIPPEWILAAPGDRLANQQYRQIGREYAFNLSRKLHQTSYSMGPLEVEIYYRESDFLQLLPTIQQSILSHSRWFGPLPFERLVILETSELQGNSQPGIISFNRPKQSLFKAVEAQWLNWRHWVIASLLASQWYGGVVGVTSPDNAWLLSGIADFATLEALSTMSLRSNFFNSYESGQQLFQFTYLQMQSLSASLLLRSAPLTVLTDHSFNSTLAAIDQHPMTFIRHALAMRQLKFLAGENIFSAFTRSFTSRQTLRNIDPSVFINSLSALPSPFSATRRQQLKQTLTEWWTKSSWPDVEMKNFTSKPLQDSKWLAEIEVEQSGEISPSIQIAVRDKSDHIYFARIDTANSTGRWMTSVVTDSEPESAEIDPNREVFDTDRFNNKSTSAPVKFFPGNATTLEDDAYTFFWLPYPFRRPGESFSIGIMASVFRYLQSSLYIRVEGAPADKRAGFMIRKEERFPSMALTGSLHAAQNYEGYRLLEAALDRGSVWRLPLPLSLGVKARHRLMVGNPDTAHVTGAVTGTITSGSLLSPCHTKLAGEDEAAPRSLSGGAFSYNRQIGVMENQCNFRGGVDILARIYAGQVLSKGEEAPPALALFQPEDLHEARLRLDVKGLKRTRKILSSSNDLLLPMIIPIPGNSLVLSRGVKFRTFFDIGHAPQEETYFRASGVGLHIPFGGDLAGVGSFALTRVSLLTVLYSQVGDEVSRQPRFLFDLSGEL